MGLSVSLADAPPCPPLADSPRLSLMVFPEVELYSLLTAALTLAMLEFVVSGYV